MFNEKQKKFNKKKTCCYKLQDNSILGSQKNITYLFFFQ